MAHGVHNQPACSWTSTSPGLFSTPLSDSVPGATTQEHEETAGPLILGRCHPLRPPPHLTYKASPVPSRSRSCHIPRNGAGYDVHSAPGTSAGDDAAAEDRSPDMHTRVPI